MKLNGFAQVGQTHCYDCGEAFEISIVGPLKAATICPSGCNRGSWIRFESDSDYYIPVKVDATKKRRQIEDRLRKDQRFFRAVAQNLI